MWYKKRKGPAAEQAVSLCGLTVDMSIVGDIIHSDDLELLRVQLFKVAPAAIDLMFEIVEI